jgi:hypothetical protein
VEVTAAELVDVLVEPLEEAVPVGLSIQYSATGVFSDGSTVPLDSEVTWISSDPAIATISQQGLADAIEQGETTISARFEDLEGEGSLAVTPAVITELEVSAEKATLFEGERMPYTATAVLSDGNAVDVTRFVYWSVEPESLAGISNGLLTSGLLRARAEGSGSVIASLDEESARSSDSLMASGSKELTVLAVSLESIEIDDSGIEEMYPGETADWSAQGFLTNGDETDVTETATWISSDPDIVTVEVVDGAAELVAVGNVDSSIEVSISAIIDGVSDTETVTVLPLEIVDIEIYPGAPDLLAIGATQQFIAIAELSNGRPRNVTEDVDWLAVDDESDETVAQFSSSTNGLALGVSEGIAAIQVTTQQGDTYSGPLLAVGEKQLDALIVVPDELTMPEDSEWPFVARAQYSDGSSADVTNLVQWLSSDDDAVEISNKKDEWGLAEAEDDDESAIITADWQDEGLSATADVQTTDECASDDDFDDRPVNIEVIPGPIHFITVGETYQMIGIGTFREEDDDDDDRETCTQSTTTQDGHWHSSDEDIVDVEHNKKGSGRITGVAVGAAQIDNEWKSVNGYTTVIVTEEAGEIESCELAANEQPESLQIVPGYAKARGQLRR